MKQHVKGNSLLSSVPSGSVSPGGKRSTAHPSWVFSSFQSGRVQRVKLDEGEASGPEGLGFVLRHRTLQVADDASACMCADPTSLRENRDTSALGSPASDLRPHNGVSFRHTGLMLHHHRTMMMMKSKADHQPKAIGEFDYGQSKGKYPTNKHHGRGAPEAMAQLLPVTGQLSRVDGWSVVFCFLFW